MTRREWLLTAVENLRNPPAHVAACLVHEESPRLCAELLLCAALGLDRLDLVRRPDDKISEADENTASALLVRRLQGEPVAYLLGQREFYGRNFAVTPATLIPRPETECMVDTALQLLGQHEGCVSFADLGCGTGCIGVTLAAERPQWRGVALDISADALAVARGNAGIHAVADRLSFVQGDMTDVAIYQRLADELNTVNKLFGNAATCSRFDLVVSNPPYISEAEYVELEPDVRFFEPKLALVTGDFMRPADGLALPAAAVQTAENLLRPGGIFLMEHGAGQGQAVRELCAVSAWERVSTVLDLAGRDRYLVAYRR